MTHSEKQFAQFDKDYIWDYTQDAHTTVLWWVLKSDNDINGRVTSDNLEICFEKVFKQLKIE